jgi:hypothetical protein
MSSQLESIYSDELFLLAETLGEVKTRTEKLEGEFSTHAKPLEAATNALSAALSGIKALQFHVLDNNLGALSARVEEMRKAVDEQVGVIALELKKADDTNAAKAGAEAEALRSEIVALQSQLGSLVTQFGEQLERVEFAAKEEAKKLQLIPGPAGAAGASLNPRGTFIDGEVYNRLDVVSWLGSSYIATVDGVTEKPSKNSNQWQTLASRGGGGAGGVGDFGSLAGVAQINQGGTGQTTRVAALNALLPDQAGSTQYMLLTDGSGTVSWGAQPVAGLPSQTSNSGRLLTTNGSTASWSNAVTVSGSNATVSGTLTVNSSSTVNGGASGTTSFLRIQNNGSSVGLLGSRAAIDGGTATDLGLYVYGANALTLWTNSSVVATFASNGSTTLAGAASVGGALFVTGVATFSDNTNYSASVRWANLSGGGTNNFINGATVANTIRFGIGDANAAYLTNTGFQVLATTASNNSSSGALVVGNGTSGGLGVGGAIWGGGKVHVGSAGYADGGAKLNVYATPSDAGYLYGIRLSDNSTATLALGLQTPTGTTSSFIHSNIALGFGTVGTAALNINTSQQVQVLTSTASTSTSSGALVVSGGVGVAGSQYLGIKLNISTHDSSAGGIGFGTETNLYRYQAGGLALDHASGAAPGLLFRENGTSTLRLETNSGVGYLSTLTAANLILRTNATTALTLDTSQNAFFAGTIRTAAPSGGTAASWKLGSVATVSPTSPNRTIEVDIGGTIYYIHAKTTNN